MWDVKKSQRNIQKTKFTCFTLTMWDVKELATQIIQFEEGVLP